MGFLIYTYSVWLGTQIPCSQFCFCSIYVKSSFHCVFPCLCWLFRIPYVLLLSNKEQIFFYFYKLISGDTLLQVASGNGLESPSSLAEAYKLQDQTEGHPSTSLKSQGTNENNHFPEEKEVAVNIYFVLFQSCSLVMHRIFWYND